MLLRLNEQRIMLMITLDCVGFTYWKVNLKPSKLLRIFKYGLDMKHNHILAHLVLLMEDNIL